MPCQLNRVDIVNCELWVCELVIFMNLLYCELVIFVNFLYYKFVILVNLLYHELWTCDLLSILFYCEVWYVYRSYFRFRPLPVYFLHRTFVSDVFEIPISFPFPELPFSILFPIKNMKTVMVLVFTDRFRPFSSLVCISTGFTTPSTNFMSRVIACVVHHIKEIEKSHQRERGRGRGREREREERERLMHENPTGVAARGGACGQGDSPRCARGVCGLLGQRQRSKRRRFFAGLGGSGTAVKTWMHR
jgi:hypothetical protein